MFGTLLSHSVSHFLEREAELLDEKLAWEPANPSCPPFSVPLSSEVVCEVMPNFLLGFWYLNSGPHACMLACLHSNFFYPLFWLVSKSHL